MILSSDHWNVRTTNKIILNWTEVTNQKGDFKMFIQNSVSGWNFWVSLKNGIMIDSNFWLF